MPRAQKEVVEFDSSRSSEAEIENFKKKIEIPHSQLQELVYNDRKYVSTIVNLIRQGVKNIRHEQYPHAMAYLAEAEKILEYGASCGRVIDRRLIICVLHNEGCCFQKSNDKPKAAKYIQAIIFNLRAHLKSLQGTPTASNIIESALLKSCIESIQITLARKLELAQYNLQFCSLNSQLSYRKQALEAAKSAIELYKGFFNEIKNEYRSIQEFDYPSLEDKNRIVACFRDFRIFRDIIDIKKIGEYNRIAKQLFKKWVSAKTMHKSILDKHFQEYSIGNLVQMDPVDYEESETSGHLLSGKKLTEQLIHFSMGYFQISTQYRLLADQRYHLNAEQRTNSDQFKYSNIYHLLSIIFISLYVPFSLLYMHQLVDSYRHHYNIDLLKDSEFCAESDLSILFTAETSKDKKLGLSTRKLGQSQRKKKENQKLNFKRKSPNSKGKNTPTKSLKKSRSNSNSVSKNEYFFKGHVQQGRKHRQMTSHSKKSAKSSNSNQSNDYYLGKKKSAEERPITAQLSRGRSSRIVSSNYSPRTRKDISQVQDAPVIDEYGTASTINQKNSAHLRDMVLGNSRNSHSHSRQKSNQSSHALRKVTTQNFMIKASPMKASVREKKKEIPGETGLRIKSRKLRSQSKMPKQKQKTKKPTHNHYL